MSTGLLIVGHGSRDSNANVEFEALVATYRSARPDLTVVHGYIELAQPSLTTALRELAHQVDDAVILPLFLFAAGHVKNDIPLGLAQIHNECPRTRFVMARPLGVHPSLVDLACAGPARVRGCTGGDENCGYRDWAWFERSGCECRFLQGRASVRRRPKPWLGSSEFYRYYAAVV